MLKQLRYITVCLMSGIAALTFVAPAMAEGEGEITIALSEQPGVLDPCMAARDNVGGVILQNISETLTEYNPATGELKPLLAVGWEQLDADTWRFQLREGVTFSDGSTFDAADVKYSMERTVSDQLSCETGAKYFGGVDITVEPVNNHTVDITADPAQPILPLLMSTLTIVPSGTPMHLVNNPIGTGPYVLAEWDRGQHIILKARDDYWGTQPAVTKATYIFRQDDAVRAAMVPAGEADIVPSLSPINATNPATDFSYPNSETLYVRIDTQTPPLNDIRVRKALNLAVNRDALIGTLIPSQAERAVTMVVPSTLGWEPDIKPWPYDPERAKALLADARADGVPVDRQIQLVCRSGNFPNVTEVCVALRHMFAAVGLNVNMQMMEVMQWMDIYSKPFAKDRPPRLVLAMHNNNRGDPVFSMYFKYACDGLQSATCNHELDRMIAKATAATGDARDAAWHAVFHKAHDLVADVFLAHMVGFTRVSKKLDFVPTMATNSQLELARIEFKNKDQDQDQDKK